MIELYSEGQIGTYKNTLEMVSTTANTSHTNQIYRKITGYNKGKYSWPHVY